MSAPTALAAGCNRNQDKGNMTTYRIEIVTNPPMVMIDLGLAKVERKTVTITGYSLADAKRRAGIQ